MNATYHYLPGPENVCSVCNGFIRWPDGRRPVCRWAT